MANKKLNMVQAINLALHEEMERDDQVIIMGEDVGQDEGVFRVLAGLWSKYGDRRVMDTPLAESGIIGTAIGMALGGMKPVAEMQFSGFSYLMIAQLAGHASRMRSRTQGQRHVPLVVRMPYGGGVRALEHHSESREATYGHFPGVKVVIPSGPRNARALMLAAIRDPDPVVFMEPKAMYRAFREDVPEESETLPIGRPQKVSEGQDLTLVAWGAMLRPAKSAAEALAEARGLSVEIFDLQTIAPLDSGPLAESLKKTGRMVVVQEAPKSLGVASEIIARMNDEALMYLETPIGRVTGYDVVTPYFGREKAYLPDAARIQRAMEQTLDT